MSESWTALDPEEGPTLWARYAFGSNHTLELVAGTDPNDPYNTVYVSEREIERLKDVIENHEQE